MTAGTTLRLAGAALIATAALGGCAMPGGGGGAPPQAPPASQGAAPRVPTPMKVDAAMANPCSVLTTAEADGQGLVPQGENTSDQLGPGCRWRSLSNQSNKVNFSVVTANKSGLDQIYLNKGRNAYFEPTTIEGYPGVYTEINDSRPSGYCSVWIGASDQLAVTVSAQLPTGSNKTNPCPVTERVAKAIVAHIKGAG